MNGRWQLPERWSWATVDDIATVVGGGTPNASDASNFAESGIPWLTPADLSGYRDTYVTKGRRDLSQKGYDTSGAEKMPAGSVLFSSRAPIGYCVIADREITTNQGFKSLVLSEGIVPEFVRHYLLASRNYAESLASGSTFKELSGSRMRELLVPIAPANEQRRIVDKLESVLARSRKAREALDAVPAMLERFRQSVLAAAFRGDLTADWRAQNPDVEPASKLLERIRAERRRQWEEVELERMAARGKPPANEGWKEKYEQPASMDPSGLAELPQGWSWASVAELADVGGGLTKNGTKRDRSSVRAPLVSVAAVQLRAIDTASIGEIGLLPEDTDRGELRPGDVLVVEGNGSLAHIGRVALWNLDLLGARHQNHIIRLRPVCVTPTFLMEWLASPRGRDAIIAEATSATGLYTLSLSKVGRLPVPVPPEDEQREILRKVSETLGPCDEIKRSALEAVQRASLIERAVLSKAFRGELVPQDPADEPASALLERIRAERAATETAPTKKGRRTNTAA